MVLSRLPASAYGPLGRVHARVSKVGFGGYRVDDRSDVHREALREALVSGVTLVDTSTNYADGHSEILVGEVVRDVLGRGSARREDLVLVTKAGYVQGSNQREAIRRARAGRPWSEMTEYTPDCWHCISPDFLADQLTASLERLALEKVDVLLLHNPEYFLTDAAHRGVPRDEARATFYERLRRALRHLEAEAAAGRIGAYGISSNTFSVPRENEDAVSLERVLENAGPGLAVVQLPFNPLETGAREPIHTPDGRSVLDVAKGAGLGVLVNRPLNAFTGRGLARFAAFAPDVLRELGRDAEWDEKRIESLASYLDTALPPGRGRGSSLAQRTIRGILETHGVDVVLVGMRRPAYVRDVVGAFA
ncbi:MAG TPA: aldo/keto reductase [Thermoanaerobaculia bacterium]|nr:aldo/keto reductase [Thermoanaerobaculia bacterium]